MYLLPKKNEIYRSRTRLGVDQLQPSELPTRRKQCLKFFAKCKIGTGNVFSVIIYILKHGLIVKIDQKFSTHKKVARL